MTRQKKIPSSALIRIILLQVIMLITALPSYAASTDCATNWSNFTNNPGYISDYTYKGFAIKDHESVGRGDPSHGQANVPPAATDLSSYATAGTNPGPQTTPFFGYYDGGTSYYPTNPSTMNDDFIFFRMRISGDPRAGGGKADFTNYHWNILVDVDGDGYKEYWIDLDGDWSQKDGNNVYYDRVQILYNNDNTQLISNPDAAGVRVNYFTARNAVDPNATCTYGYSHTRAYAVGDGSPDWYVEYQVPMTAFKDSQGNQVLFPDSPVAFVYSTGASNQDPLQKDWMMDLNFLSDTDPITFGDIIMPDGEPQIYFTNSAFDSADFYTVGNNVYVSVTDRFANTDPSTVQTITVTVTDPATGDDQQITLTETGPSTGIFHSSALPAVASDSTFNNSDSNGSIEVAQGNALYVTYTNSRSYTVTDQAAIIGTNCDAFMELTRANGLPSAAFELNSDSSLSDRLYLTIFYNNANSNPATQQQITNVNLTGVTGDSLSLSPTVYPLIETGNNTGVFRNTTGITTQNAYPPITTNTIWEDVDGGVVTATYTYTCGGNSYTKSTTAQLFYTAAAGRVSFTNQSGTSDETLYTAGQSVYLKVQDANACTTLVGGVNTVTATVTSPVGDSESVRLYETFPGSYVFMNSSTPVTTATYGSSYTVNNGIISALNNDTLTVSYTDCNDGDTNPSNNNKTDTALFNTPPLLINQVLFYPDGANTVQSEYMQIYNASSQSITATGYRVTDGDALNYTLQQLNGSDIVLAPGQKLYVSFYPTDASPTNFFDSGTGAYYLFAAAGTSLPSDELGDPAAVNPADHADQMSLYDTSGTIVDYAAWSATLSPSVDFMSDFSAAVAQDIWQDGAFVNVNGIQPGYHIYRCQNGVAHDGYDTNQPSDWCVSTTQSPVYQTIITYVSISAFDAYEDNGRVVVQWETSAETGTVGFYLLRQNMATGGYKPVAKDMIPSVMDRNGGVYRIVDPTAKPGKSYTYLLLEVEGVGTERTYGPYTVAVGGRNGKTSMPAAFSLKKHELTKTQEARIKAAKDVREAVRIKKAKRIGAQLKMAVTGEGLYTLDAARIASLLDVRAKSVMRLIKTNQFMLMNKGQQVAYMALPDGSGLIFYGEGPGSIYTDENIYWLSRGKGLAMKTVTTGVVAEPALEETFAYEEHFEKDSFDAPGFFTDPSEDYWFWDYVFGGDPDYDSKSFMLHTGGVAPSASYDAKLTVRLQGASDTEESPDHHITVGLNGSKLGDVYLDGMGKAEETFSFSQGLLKDGDNIVEISDVLDNGAPYSVVFINSLDVAYQRLYLAEDNKLVFRGDGNQPLSINGFTRPEIMLFDITDQRRPKSVKNAAIKADNGGYRLLFNSASPNSVYLAAAQDRVTAVSDIAADVPSALKSKGNRADYLIITAAELRNDAEALAAYRRSGGLEVMVADVEDIMDEFNYGIYNPGAIRTFLMNARAKWKKAPRYVVLAGDGTDDYRDRMGYGGNLVPPVMVGTKDGLIPADNYYADVNADHLPEIAIGRLPAVTPAELQNMIAKIITYENPAARTGERKMILAADYPEIGGQFTADSDAIAPLLPQGYPATKVYLSEQSFENARQQLLDGLNSGSLFLNYVGHGGLDRLSQDGLLTISDLDAVTNAGRLPIMTAMTCVTGNFTIAGFHTLAEEMLIRKDIGTVAVWTATGMSESTEAAILDRSFYRAVFQVGEKVLGDAVLKAFKEYRRQRRDMNIPYIYNLLGDPALKMTVK